MKKILLILLFILPLATAENLYLEDSLNLELKISGGFELNSENSNAKIEEVKANLLLVPIEDYRQTKLDLQSVGEQKENQVEFVWKNLQLGEQRFGYISKIETNNKRKKVKEKILFPLSDVSGYEEYLLPTNTIDSNNQEIIEKAQELADGKEDLFEVAFTLASWVEENVDYDLNTLTAKASQKASWVLKNRQGVCDEMTSLFIAMARSLGIPARFVTGISYTSSDLFSEPWQPHGWAEIYFPSLGWVNFDITFGEYGYVDVTHIKLKEGKDPKEPATQYEWRAHNVELETLPLEFDVKILSKGKPGPQEIELEIELLNEKLGFGSYELVKGTIKNTVDYYLASSLKLYVPPEIMIINENKRNIFLPPLEEVELYWILKIPEDLDKTYEYQFPILLSSEKNESVGGLILNQENYPHYTEEEVRNLVPKKEENKNDLSLNCNYPKQILIHTEVIFSCKIKNQGNINYNNVNFCLDKICEKISLPSNSERTEEITLSPTKSGWDKVFVTATSRDLEIKKIFNYLVEEESAIKLSIDVPKKVEYGEIFDININLEKKSVISPKDVIVTLETVNAKKEWKIKELNLDQKLSSRIDSNGLSSKNTLKVKVTWLDQDNNKVTKEQEAVVLVKTNNFKDKLVLFFNGVFGFFF